MYSSFYGFSEKPFDVTPDPKFLYLSPGHRETLAALLYGIRERRGFIAVVGEVGTGKTTLINTVLGRLDQKTKVAYLFNTDLTFDELLSMALAELNLMRSDESIKKVNALSRLNDFAIRQLAGGGNVVLIVDEAQNLDNRSMENLRLLSNLETRKQKLIQIVLCGQPELDAKLNRPELRQLAQRLSLKRYITPLSEKETYEYIKHRLNIAECNRPTLFNRGAQQLIWVYSGGVPRKINILCDNALLIGYAGEKKKIKEDVVEEAVRDLTWSPFLAARTVLGVQQKKQASSRTRRFIFRPAFAISTGLVLATCLVFLFVQYIFPSRSNTGEKTRKSKRHATRTWIVRKPISFSPVQNSLRLNTAEQEAAIPGYPSSSAEVPAANSQSLSPDDQAPDSEQSLDAPEKADKEKITEDTENGAEAAMPGEPVKEEVSEESDLTAGPSEEVESETGPAKSLTSTDSDNGEGARDVSRNRNISSDLTSASSKENTAQTASQRIIVVKDGECLSSIIARTCGRYDKAKLENFMRANPEIENPDVLLVGQALTVPAVSDKN